MQRLQTDQVKIPLPFPFQGSDNYDMIKQRNNKQSCKLITEGTKMLNVIGPTSFILQHAAISIYFIREENVLMYLKLQSTLLLSYLYLYEF